MRSPRDNADSRAMTKPLVLSKSLVKVCVHDAVFEACDAAEVATKQRSALGERLQELADAYGMVLGALALESGTTRTHLQTIADSGNCQLKVIAGIYERTRVDLNWLIAGVGELNRETLRHLSAKERAARIAERTKRRPKLSPSVKVRVGPTKDDPSGSKRPRRG